MSSKNKQQSGRSMVEMLGVLAIIGVLSIGGIAGYTLSMRRHRANQVLDAANKYSLIAYGACQQEIINGGITTISKCGTNIPPSFDDAGLGTVSDAESIKFVKITSKSGQDIVNIQTTFHDNAICIATKSIIGATESASAACQGNGNGVSAITIPIKQN